MVVMTSGCVVKYFKYLRFMTGKGMVVATLETFLQENAFPTTLCRE